MLRLPTKISIEYIFESEQQNETTFNCDKEIWNDDANITIKCFPLKEWLNSKFALEHLFVLQQVRNRSDLYSLGSLFFF